MVWIWIVLYGVTYTLSGLLPDGEWGTPAAMLGYTALLLLWLWRKKKFASLGLGKTAVGTAKGCGYFLPLLALPVYHLIAGGMPPVGLSGVILTVSVAVVEELFFRGAVQGYLLKRTSPLWGILIGGIGFGLLHGANLLTGAPPAYTLLQILCAASVGIGYGAAAYRCKSILPCICAHFLTNITAPSGLRPGGGLWLCMLIPVLYALILGLCPPGRKKEK